MCTTCGCGNTTHQHPEQQRLISLEQDILATNDHYARHNREYFQAHNIKCINLLSSPGSGKTTILEKSLQALAKRCPIAVIEGDQQTDRDAQRIAATGVAVKQINTGKVCHLDGHMIGHAITDIHPQDNSLLFIENVGNLVCPSLFDLGENYRAVILSITEGEDKPLKYPHMFQRADVIVINKMDLLPHLEFDLEQCIAYIRQVNPKATILQVSAKTDKGLMPWIQWLTDND